MEGIAKTRLLSLLGGKGFDRLQVEVVVKVEVVEVLAVDEEVEHVVALSAHLQPHLHPVQLCGLEELGGLEGPKQVPSQRAQAQPSLQHTHIHIHVHAY